MKKKGFLRKTARGFNTARLIIINLLFWVIIPLAILIGIGISVKGTKIDVPSKGVLDLDLSGKVVNRYSSDEFDRKFKEAMAAPDNEILLSNIIKTIDMAAEDKRITAILLKTDRLGGTDLAALKTIRDSLIRFKESGKPVLAYSEDFSQTGYYLASVSDEIVLDSMGSVPLKGLGVMQSYFKGGLDKLGVEVAVFRAGEFKSFVEPFTETGMSEEVKNQTLLWLNSIWSNVLSDISSSRNIKKNLLESHIENYNNLLEETWDGGAKLALKTKLIDKIMTPYQFNNYVDGGTSPMGSVKDSIYWQDYFSVIHNPFPLNIGKKNIAVVVAEGDIIYGYGPRGTIASHSYSDLLDRIAEDDSVAGVVFRINSGGGSAVAAEHIRRGIERLEEEGIPVVASFGGVAASGGYWIGSEARYIFAQPTTITGSIGVFTMFPMLEDAFKEHLGITFDGVGTGSRALEGRFNGSLSESEAKYYKKMVNAVYSRFKELVVNNRQIDPAKFDELAGGRVWSGEQAIELHLVDELGSLNDAVEYVADLSGLKGYSVVYYEPEEIREATLLSQFIKMAQSKKSINIDTLYSKGLEELQPDFNDPKGISAYFSFSLLSK